ncbi:CoB--CoM heterodisulfide reductase iron-sulfur subunit A family protein [uncultured Desulfatiglans sp.]|uniref:CoB--CoM heterodisulfide reductase iron-sulfur subunit A family protein n=1 Tax=Uncultured Desulfatiglans sp. TaxID=1748965 RepID=A0A653A437_UNCDX|nr:CoB--CoM heterodisulfide reductase iron-sulfur subunit A family protein [uncultured Desulfatiglans sp.]
MSQNKPKGSVAVIGGGIAGIQAALSLADAGYGVHVVERMATLGGMIPNLHRFYPLCACCKVNPKIAACQQNPNVNVLTDTQVTGISGELGRFTLNVEQGGVAKQLEAGAVVFAAGIEAFDPSQHDTYAYHRYPNVVTSVEYEQLQKPTGQGKGIVKRPSDGQSPQKIAWLQCVGSRDINRCDAPYCSSVCCMYALKEAVNSVDVDENVEPVIFYMDMRTHGKGFEAYLNDAKARGIRLVRSRIHTVDPEPGSDDLKLTYADEAGTLQEETFNMIVLSVGLKPAADAIALAEKMGLQLSPDRFLATPPFQPVGTSLPGVFTCGGMSGPLDIGQSITQANAVAAEIAAVLDPAALAPPVMYPQIVADPDAEPKILVAYHLCPGMDPGIGKRIEAFTSKLPKVASVAGMEGAFLDQLVQSIQSAGANRLVFASCTPLIHKALLEEALKRSGLNPALFELVDLRVLDIAADTQLNDRLRMGVARAALSTPTPVREVPVTKQALVVGGGLAGMESALAIAREGFPVTLVEKDAALGGHALHVRSTWQGYDVQAYLKDLLASVQKNSLITVLTGATVKESHGFEGQFLSTLEQGGKSLPLAHGVTVLATGGDPVPAVEYLYGQNDQVYLWNELSTKLLKDPKAIESASSGVFIQCVGSREPERPHCSNLCCAFAVRTAIDLKEKNPNMDIYILYREMRTFGEREELYRTARQKGVVFIRYDLEHKPAVTAADGRLTVTVFDPILGKDLALPAEFVSLQTAITAPNNTALPTLFRVGLDEDGFLAESPEKMKPSDTTIKGIFQAGLAHYPKDTLASIAQAKAAAGRALEVLKQETVQAAVLVAEVRPEKCAVCCTCVRTCPFHVPYIDHDRGAAYIDPALCQGCGMCVAECPGKAIVMPGVSDQMLNQAPSILMETN